MQMQLKTPYSQQFQQKRIQVPLVVQLLLQQRQEQGEFHTPHDGQHLQSLADAFAPFA
jgi:hypothetical protein